MPFVRPSKCLGAPGDQRGEQGFHTRYPLMGWSGRAPAPTAIEAGKGRQRRGACHVLQANYGIAVLAGLRRQAAIAKCTRPSALFLEKKFPDPDLEIPCSVV